MYVVHYSCKTIITYYRRLKNDKKEAIKYLKEMKDECDDTFHKVRYVTQEEALEMAIQALENIGHLKDRPYSVCEFHKENRCCQ